MTDRTLALRTVFFTALGSGMYLEGALLWGVLFLFVAVLYAVVGEMGGSR